MNQEIELKIIEMSEVESKEISWLWYPFIPYGKIDERKYEKMHITDYSSITSLQSHLKTEHGKTICTICAKMKRMFPFEFKLYHQQVGM